MFAILLKADGYKATKNSRKSKYNIIFETSIAFLSENMQSKSAKDEYLGFIQST